MSLHLITVLIHAAEEVCTTMHIEHDSVALFATLLSLCIMRPHFNPFRLQHGVVSSPLPPLAASNFVHTVMAQLSSESLCCLSDRVLRYCYFLHLDPVRIGYPLRGEALKLFDSVEGSMVEKLAYEIQPFMVRDMSCGLLAKRLSIEVLSEVSRLSLNRGSRSSHGKSRSR